MTKKEQFGLSFHYRIDPRGMKKPQCTSKTVNANSHLTLLNFLDFEETESLIDDIERAQGGLQYDQYPSSDSYDFIEIYLNYPNVTIDGVLTVSMIDFKELLKEWQVFLRQ